MTVLHEERQAQPHGKTRPKPPYFVAQQYADLGLSPLQVRHQSMVPAVKWKSYDYNPLDFTQMLSKQVKDPDTGKIGTVRATRLSKKFNIGLRTGYEYGLAVLDFDTPKAFIRAARANPRLLLP